LFLRLTDKNFDFMGRRKIWYIISAAIILAGIIGFIVNGFNFGIDFRGGSLMEVEFSREVDITELREVMAETGHPTAILQRSGSRQFIIRTLPVDTEEKNEILDALDEEIGIQRPILQNRNVLPTFSRLITRLAMIAVAISIAGILGYIWIRFEVRFAIAAIFALIHDVTLTLGFYALFNREINIATIAVILSLLGYSINDTIVVFDRIREDTRTNRSLRYEELVNSSVNKTLSRSINTSITTLFPVIILLIIGNQTLRDFAFGLTIGITAGAYSSIFIASPILVMWNNRFPRYKR
jgi:preprotein translocase subunit SecF